MNLLYKALILIVVSYFSLLSQPVWSLACYSSDAGGAFGSGNGGVSRFYIDPSASVPDSAPDDQIVWRGPSQTVEVTCYKDASNYPDKKGFSEQIYFWPGNTHNIGLPDISGIRIGFRYKGADIYGAKAPVEGFVVQACDSNESNQDCESRTRVTKVITYQPIILTAPGSFTGYPSPLNIFQLDGEEGYNIKFNNYYSVIDNMDILKPSKCEVEIELENNDVNFGLLNSNNIREMVTLPVNIIVRNLKQGSDCPAVKLRGYFNNVRDVSNNDYVPVFDMSGNLLEGIGIKISSQESGQNIPLNEPIGSGYEIISIGHDRYNATLYAIDPQKIELGEFEAMVVYSVSYL